MLKVPETTFKVLTSGDDEDEIHHSSGEGVGGHYNLSNVRLRRSVFGWG
jgi:hypothetical protein